MPRVTPVARRNAAGEASTPSAVVNSKLERRARPELQPPHDLDRDLTGARDDARGFRSLTRDLHGLGHHEGRVVPLVHEDAIARGGRVDGRLNVVERIAAGRGAESEVGERSCERRRTAARSAEQGNKASEVRARSGPAEALAAGRGPITGSPSSQSPDARAGRTGPRSTSRAYPGAGRRAFPPPESHRRRPVPAPAGSATRCSAPTVSRLPSRVCRRPQRDFAQRNPRLLLASSGILNWRSLGR
jgi:hypothetical protein